MGFSPPYTKSSGEKQSKEIDPVTGSKNSSTFELSADAIELVSKIIHDELSETSQMNTKKEQWIQLGIHLEKHGIPKQYISKQAKNIIEYQLYLKLKDQGIPQDECRISGISHFYKTMKENNWTDPDMANNTQKTKKHDTTIIPDTPEFQTLSLIRKLFGETINTIDVLLNNCTYNPATIQRQIQHNKIKRTTDDYDKLFQETKKLVTARIAIVISELSAITPEQIRELEDKVTQITTLRAKLNDKTKLTLYEKEFARLLIQRFGYDAGFIAKVLHINTKHIKNNILKQNDTPLDQDSIFRQLDFLYKCPGCGLGIADHFDASLKAWEEGKTLNQPLTLESFPMPKYCDEIISLKSRIRDQSIIISELKAK